MRSALSVNPESVKLRYRRFVKVEKKSPMDHLRAAVRSSGTAQIDKGASVSASLPIRDSLSGVCPFHGGMQMMKATKGPRGRLLTLYTRQ